MIQDILKLILFFVGLLRIGERSAKNVPSEIRSLFFKELLEIVYIINMLKDYVLTCVRGKDTLGRLHLIFLIYQGISPVERFPGL